MIRIQRVHNHNLFYKSTLISSTSNIQSVSTGVSWQWVMQWAERVIQLQSHNYKPCINKEVIHSLGTRGDKAERITLPHRPYTHRNFCKVIFGSYRFSWG